jgi:hypothetical protein
MTTKESQLILSEAAIVFPLRVGETSDTGWHALERELTDYVVLA